MTDGLNEVACVFGNLTIEHATSSAATTSVEQLFRAYADSLGVDLSYQGFEEELATLPGDYQAPTGVLLLARLDQQPVGCVGVRALTPELCEMKRLYAAPRVRGHSLGRNLVIAAVQQSRALGFRAMRLDTLPTMLAAHRLYRRLGFVEIAPYYDSPVEGTLYFELDMVSLPSGFYGTALAPSADGGRGIQTDEDSVGGPQR